MNEADRAAIARMQEDSRNRQAQIDAMQQKQDAQSRA